MLEVLYGMGLRASELVALSLGDVDLDERLMRVWGKGGKERVVPVGRHAADAVGEWLSGAGRGALEPAAWRSRDDAAAVFLNARGRRITRQGVWLIVRRHGDRVGLGPDQLTTHVLAPLVRNAHARRRCRHPQRARAARPRVHLQHAALHRGLTGTADRGLPPSPPPRPLLARTRARQGFGQSRIWAAPTAAYAIWPSMPAMFARRVHCYPPPPRFVTLRKRIGTAAVAVCLVAALAALVPAGAAAAEGGSSDVSISRYGGADRYETSLQVAETVATDAGGSLTSVVLVSGRRWTDAVVAAPVAGALGAPVLMTPPGELRADALEFLQRVWVCRVRWWWGPMRVAVSTAQGRGVSASVLEALEAAGISTERIGGR